MTKGLASEARLQCTFACHSAAWSPDGSRIAIADGDQRRVVLMASAIDSALRPITPEGENNHFPTYLANGTVVYVSEHIALDQSWTDLWSTDPVDSDTRTPVAQNVLAQGPFEISADGKQLLFASPRSGNFEIYAVTLDNAGKAALATRPDQLGTPDVVAPRTTIAGSTTSPDGSLVAYAGIAVLILVGLAALVSSRRRSARR
jgi:Tol biopolymer transport system component